MKYKALGNTGLFVSELSLGTMTFGGTGGIWGLVGTLGQKEVNELVAEALDAGVNFFDTANVYAEGRSEELLGNAIKSRRKEVIIATKVRSRSGPGVNQVGLTRAHIMDEIDASLKRLGTDYIDMYLIHNSDPIADWEDTLRALDDLVRSGKVRYIGCSNLSGWEIMKARGISQLHNLNSFKCSQSYYSLVGRDIEREVIPVLRDQNMGLLVWSPLAGGFLSGKFTRDQSDIYSRRSKFDFPPVNKEKGYAIIDVLQEIAAQREVSVGRVALAWLLHQSAVTSVVVGARNTNQLRDNLQACELTLTESELSSLDEVSRLSMEYPGWMNAGPSDRFPR
ncbi:aldo/keto reductase [Bacillus paralicheniformis]|uniref:aldo/keto reductase n=1 Tax=Bacillus paralicheniformis TaxID=1648923 RepID=UPI000D023199|nr:aldo/keto reductase [Bacillus paralicheniformis]